MHSLNIYMLLLWHDITININSAFIALPISNEWCMKINIKDERNIGIRICLILQYKKLLETLYLSSLC